MKTISGIKDVDREILLKMSDKELLKTCSINKYFQTEVCDDNFLRRRLEQTYPDTIKYRGEQKWRPYFLDVIYSIAKMKELYGYDYKGGDPNKQYSIFRESGMNPNTLLLSASINGEISLVIEALEHGINISRVVLENALKYGQVEIVKYLVEKEGADIQPIKQKALQKARERGDVKVIKYLEEI